MITRKTAYWIIQVFGWSGVILINIITASFSKRLTSDVYFSGFLLCVCGILVTHGFREISKQLQWTSKSVLSLIPRIIFGSLGMSLIYTLLYGSLNDLFIPNAKQVLVFGDMAFVNYVLNFFLLFLIWSLLYFAIHSFENYKAKEIDNLKLQAAMSEIELSSIKAQMNPHFMFNALNSIRALIDEDPHKAKEAINSLSLIMRNILMSAKRQLVPFKEELTMVKKYLALEKIRFEERLLVNIDVEKSIMDYPFPPLMLQTIVENGVKHGISKLKDGGMISILARQEDGKLYVDVFNSGELQAKDQSSTGIGVSNTQKRLKSLYDGQGSFELSKSGEYVKASIIIPYRKKYESTHY